MDGHQCHHFINELGSNKNMMFGFALWDNHSRFIPCFDITNCAKASGTFPTAQILWARYTVQMLVTSLMLWKKRPNLNLPRGLKILLPLGLNFRKSFSNP